MLEINDINDEYEKIFGVTKHENLFAADDEEYNLLRQQILEEKRVYYTKKHLPFDGIEIDSYEVYLRKEIIAQEEKKGYRIFYIKEFDNQELVCYAAGYVDNSTFVVLRGSFFKRTEYFINLANHLPEESRNNFLSNFSYYNGILTQKKNWIYESASLAASFIKGRKVLFTEWRDNRGKTLDSYFNKYKESSIYNTEEKTFPYYEHNNLSFASNRENSEESKSSVNSETVSTTAERHLFSIQIHKKCNAFGYHDINDKRFIILRGSTFEKNVDSSFNTCSLGVSRQRFINAACEEKSAYYEVKDDTKCKSAAAAASYLVGQEVSDNLWKDYEGKCLSDIYPTIYKKNEVDKKQSVLINNTIKKGNIVFYIKKCFDNNGCAYGTFDNTTNTFILKAGSLLTNKTTAAFAYSAKGIHRMNFINKYCSKTTDGYKLRKDYAFESPSAAASHVLGRSANGWLEWKDEVGNSLDSLFR